MTSVFQQPARLSYKDQPQYYKLPKFEVLELLTNDESGLYGFQMHFSNGTSARFARHEDSTECINITLRDTIGFLVGNLDELRDEWRIGEKGLYEIGLSGRYNKLGEWRPIIYPGDSHPLQSDARALSDDADVQGALFYMMCTGHRILEFVVRASIDLPRDYVCIGGSIHLTSVLH